jgi:hypothetical protein
MSSKSTTWRNSRARTQTPESPGTTVDAAAGARSSFAVVARNLVKTCPRPDGGSLNGVGTSGFVRGIAERAIGGRALTGSSSLAHDDGDRPVRPSGCGAVLRLHHSSSGAALATPAAVSASFRFR